MRVPDPVEVEKLAKGRERIERKDEPMSPSERYNALLRMGGNEVHGLGDLPGRGTYDALEVPSRPPILRFRRSRGKY
jgi:hypothetical protein